MKKRQIKQIWKDVAIGALLLTWIFGGIVLIGYLEQLWNITQ